LQRIVFVSCVIALAASQSSQSLAASTDAAATVNGVTILVEEVRASLAATLQNQSIDAHTRKALEAAALAKLIDRELVTQALAATGIRATDKQVQTALAKFKRQLDVQQKSLDEYLSDHALTLDLLKTQLRWQLTWNQHLQKELAEEQLEEFFAKHRRRFDGTELQASQIFLRPDPPGDSAAKQKLAGELAGLREKIVKGEITFEVAARKHSVAPSAASGGDVGFFPRRGVMADAFAEAAFALQVGQISPPVVTPLGVHLIKVTGSKPGSKQLSQVREDVRAAAAQQLFSEIARRQRKTGKIVFASGTAYDKSGPQDVVPTKK